MKHRIWSLLAVLLVLFHCVIAVGAASSEEGSHSIEIAVQYGGKPIRDGALTAILIGYADQDLFRNILTDQEISAPASRETADAMQAFYYKNNRKYDFYEQTADIKDGTAQFSQLRTGLYLIIQKDHHASAGFYPLNGFLVSIPWWDGTGYQYDVRVAAKTSPDRIPPETPDTEETPGQTATPPTEPEETVPELPQTGQLSWPVPAMAVCGMLLFAIGWWLYTADRKDADEK